MATGPGAASHATASGSPADASKSIDAAFDEMMKEGGPGAKEGTATAASERWANALDAVLPPPADPDQLISNTASSYAQSMKDYYAYYSSALRHRRALFDWQLLSARIIFVVVIALVVSGVVFAALQFFRDRGVEVSTIDASATGIRVSSPVLGIIILSLSLLFFYLYLIYVYPIHEAITPK